MAPDPVRPTKSTLESLSIPIPDLGVRLGELNHPLIVKAQAVPELADKNAAERIRSITDRVWLKVKASNLRGAVADLSVELPDQFERFGHRWWLCAAGVRQDDSPQLDFYARLTKAAFAGGPNSCSSDFLMPTRWDHDRLEAEAGLNAVRITRELVIACAALSLRSSAIRGFTLGDRDVRVRIHVHQDGLAYIVIGATGSLDPTFFIALISAIPGVPAEDWLPEPNGKLPIDLAPGEIVWSAMLPTETQELLLNFDVDGYE